MAVPVLRLRSIRSVLLSLSIVGVYKNFKLYAKVENNYELGITNYDYFCTFAENSLIDENTEVGVYRMWRGL